MFSLASCFVSCSRDKSYYYIIICANDACKRYRIKTEKVQCIVLGRRLCAQRHDGCKTRVRVALLLHVAIWMPPSR